MDGGGGEVILSGREGDGSGHHFTPSHIPKFEL